jgi:small conductance mechanosensitive channel
LRFCIIPILAIAALLAPYPAAAQAPQPPATTAAPAPDRRADLQALDRLLGLLENDAERARLVGDLKQLRAGLVPPDGAKDGAATDDGEGLIGALATGIASVGQELPAGDLGTALDRRFGRAVDQVEGRIAAGLREGRIKRFALHAAPGWAAALLTAWLLARTSWVRRGRALRREAARMRARGTALWRLALGSSLRELLPLLGATAVLAAWPLAGLLTVGESPLFLALAVPALAAGLAHALAVHALMPLGPVRSWRMVTFAQRRVAPWLAALAGAVVAAGILRTPALRGALGPDPAELLALVADVAVAGLVAAFVVRHRRTVRHLLMGRRLRPEQEQAFHPIRRVLRRMVRRWHVLALLFVAANLVARLLGLGDGHAVRNTMLALLAVALGLALALAFDGALVRLARRFRRGRSGTMRRIVVRVLEMLRLVGHVAVTAGLLVAVLEIWGFEVREWLASDVGAGIARPLLSILSVVAFAWLTWIAIDSAIAEALAPVDGFGQRRMGSSRAKTLLPFLKNLAFVTLCLLAAITILDDLGVNVAPLLAGAGVVGLAVGFGSQQLVQDLITGLFILFEDTIAVGDVIDTGDRAGVVEALTIRTVRLRDGDGALHAIPFSQIKALKNRSRDYGVYTVKVTVGYDADLERVMAVMRDIAAELQADPRFSWSILAPLELWGVDAFTPEGVVVMGAIRTRPLQQWTVGRELNLRLKRRLDELGILIAIPRMSLVPPHPREAPREPDRAGAAAPA